MTTWGSLARITMIAMCPVGVAQTTSV